MKNLTWRAFDSEKILGWVVSGLAFLFPVTVLSVNRADSVILFTLGVIGVYAFLRHGVRGLALDRRALIMMGLFAGWYAVIVLCYFLGDRTPDGFKLLGRYLRLLFFIPALIACHRYLVRPRWLFVGLLLAPFPALGLALWQYIGAHSHIRASGFIDPIPFGDLSMTMGFTALVLLLDAQRRHKTWLYILSMGAFLAGLMTSLLSESRGGWAALPLIAVITIIVFSRNSWKRALKALVIFSVITIVAIILIPGTIVLNRISEAINNLENYRIYLKLVEEGDVDRYGCLNSNLSIHALARALQERYSPEIQISVIEDTAGLKQSNLLKLCQSDAVLEIKNMNSQRAVTFYIQRISLSQTRIQSVEFILRGDGMISIRTPPDLRAWERFSNKNYAIVRYIKNVKNSSCPLFWLPPGATLRLIPMQNNAGEYIYQFSNNSFSARLEMWRSAWRIFMHHPIFGAGTGSFMLENSINVRAGDVSPVIIYFDHPHNDYMNALASWGLFGVMAYILIMCYPLVLFARALRSENEYGKAAGFVGVLMISGLLIFGLTETMFTHSIVISWYVTFTAMLMAIILRQNASGRRDGRT